MGKDHTLFAKIGGKVEFQASLKRRTMCRLWPVSEAGE